MKSVSRITIFFCWIIVVVASVLSIRATVFGLESLLAGGSVPILIIAVAILIQATLVVCGTQMFGINSKIYRYAYLLAASFSVTFGISYFLVHAGLEEQIIQEQFSGAKNRLSDNVERSKATLDEFQNALINLVAHSNQQADKERSTGGTCQNIEYVGDGPRYRLRKNDARSLNFHAKQVGDVNRQLDKLSGQLANIPDHDASMLRRLTIRSASLVNSKRIVDVQQWVNQRVNKREHQDEVTGQYFPCLDSTFDSLGRIVTLVELRALDVPDLHHSREGSGFKITASIFHNLLTLNFEKITPYHLLGILFTLLVEGVIWLMLYALHQGKSPLQEHLSSLNKANQISDRVMSLLDRITNSYSGELIDLQSRWNDRGGYYRASIQLGTRSADFALWLERLGIAKQTNNWISKGAGMLGHQRKHRMFKFNKLLMQSLLMHQAGQQQVAG